MPFQLSERFGLFGMSLRNIFPAKFQQLFSSKRVIGAIQVLRNADGGGRGVSSFPKYSVTKV